MKIIIFNGGLGNQIFIYLFSLYVSRHNARKNVYGVYLSRSLNLHNGLEIDRVFNIRLPQRSFISDVVATLYKILKSIGLVGKNNDGTYYKDKIVYDHYWLNKKFYKDTDLRKCLSYREEAIDTHNKDVATELQNIESVAVHIRRGDYLTEENYQNFGQFCTEEYYRKAISYIKEKKPGCVLCFFSDDIEYVKKQFKYSKARYYNINNGDDSWKDMYLMSHCHHHIIANSTFSYWGAMLAKPSPDHIAIAPRKWFIWDDPDIFPDYWKRM